MANNQAPQDADRRRNEGAPVLPFARAPKTALLSISIMSSDLKRDGERLHHCRPNFATRNSRIVERCLIDSVTDNTP